MDSEHVHGPRNAGDVVHVRAVRRAVCRAMLFVPLTWWTCARWTDDVALATCADCRRAFEEPGLL